MKTSRRAKVVAVFSLPFLAIAITNLHAGSATWLQNPADGNWNNAANWTAGGPPNGSSDTATFASSNTTGISLSANTEVNGIVFNAGASTFAITSSEGSGLQLTISGLGIMNNSGINQNFVEPPGTFGNYGEIVFTNSATAGTLTMFTNNGGHGLGSMGGLTSFHDTSTADNGTFINNGGSFGQAGGGAGGAVEFLNSSTAANGTFTNNGGTYPGASGGSTGFTDNSSAASGIFTNNGGAAAGTTGGQALFSGNSTAGSGFFTNNGTAFTGATGGSVQFFNTSAAGNATLVANSGTNAGGFIRFGDDSTGGTARVEVFGNGMGNPANGTVDIRPHRSATVVTIGSLEGNGNVFVGNNNLSVGSNNTSRSFSGLIQDADASGGQNGVFGKIGTGTLTFEGGTSNDYIGDAVTLSIASNSMINLNFTGDPDTVRSLIVGGVGQLPGLYGSAASGAPHQLPQFAGTGRVLARMVAVSRKTHGAAGDFDINLPFGGVPGIECRSGGANGNYQVVVTFLNAVTFETAGVSRGVGGVSSTTGNGTTVVTVNLTNVTNAQTIFVTLYNVNDGTTTETIPIPMSILTGDTGENGVVNASDVTQTKAQTGQPITSSNFREDVNGNGVINASDVTLVKSRVGTALP